MQTPETVIAFVNVNGARRAARIATEENFIMNMMLVMAVRWYAMWRDDK